MTAVVRKKPIDPTPIARTVGPVIRIGSFVMRVAWEHDMKIHSANAGLAMNFSSDAVQEVAELYMEVRGLDGAHMDPHTDKLVRDSIIWTHLAADSVQRMKVARRLGR